MWRLKKLAHFCASANEDSVTLPIELALGIWYNLAYRTRLIVKAPNNTPAIFIFINLITNLFLIESLTTKKLILRLRKKFSRPRIIFNSIEWSEGERKENKSFDRLVLCDDVFISKWMTQISRWIEKVDEPKQSTKSRGRRNLTDQLDGSFKN